MYAIGEIVLVIIGIMIAVGLNNSNEARKQDKKIEAILVQIQNELTTAIEDANYVIQDYGEKDSLIYLVMNNKVSREEFRKRENVGLRFISTNYNTLSIQNDGFNNLMLKSEIMPDKYLPLVNGLKQFYIHRRNILNELNELLGDGVTKTNAVQRENYDWYADYNFLNGIMTDEILDYYMNDRRYKNSIVDYSITVMENLLGRVIAARIDAIYFVREIDALLEQDNSHSFDVNGNDYVHWNGKYHYRGDTVEFANDADGMKWFNEGEWQEIYPLSKTKFHFSDRFFCQFLKDDNGEIDGISVHYTNTNITYQKIKAND